MNKLCIIQAKLFQPILLVTVFFLFGIIRGYSENEPNNSRETANTFGLNSSISGSFSQSDSSDDFYKITTTTDGKLVLSVSSDAALCVGLTIVSENGTINLHNNGSCGGSYINPLTVNNLAAGIYYIWAGNTGFGSYTISNTFTSATLTNDPESNDSRETALSFGLNTSATGHLGYKNMITDDVDYYKITTLSDGKLTLSTVPDESLCIELTIISENGTMNLYSNGLCSMENHSNSLVVNNLAAGTYYVSAIANGYGSYTFTNMLEPTILNNDEELNDSRETAVTVNQNSSFEGHLGYKYLYTDVDDFYKIVTSAEGKLTLNVTSDSTLCVDLTLINESGSFNIAANGSCNNSSHTGALVHEKLAAGTYYIRASSSGTGYGSYKITTALTNITAINEITQHSIKLFPNPAGNIIYIEGNTLKDIRYRIFDFSGKTWMSGKITSGDKQFKIDISSMKTGVYFIELNEQLTTRTQKFIKK